MDCLPRNKTIEFSKQPIVIFLFANIHINEDFHPCLWSVTNIFLRELFIVELLWVFLLSITLCKICLPSMISTWSATGLVTFFPTTNRCSAYIIIGVIICTCRLRLNNHRCIVFICSWCKHHNQLFSCFWCASV